VYQMHLIEQQPYCLIVRQFGQTVIQAGRL
jgi:hypothetical protein